MSSAHPSRGLAAGWRATCCLSAVLAGSAHAAQDLESTDAALALSARLRVETVDDSRFASNADAETWKLLASAWSPERAGLRAVVSGEVVDHLGPQRYNDTVNGQVARPAINDPDSVEIDEAYVAYRTQVAGGVQKFWGGRRWQVYDQQRYVGGGPGWRNNNQSFDGAGAELVPWHGASLQLSHVERVHRVLGRHSPNGHERLRGEFAQLSAPVSSLFTASAYGFWIDFRDSHPFPQSASSQTQGATLAGKIPLGAAQINIHSELAWQSGYADGSSGNDATYRQLSLGVASGGLRTDFAYEHLGGDGEYAFQTPLASLHGFNGWADRFVRTPLEGLDDFSGALAYSARNAAWNSAVIHHQYRAPSSDRRLGSEWDLLLSAALGSHARFGRLTGKFAAYRGSDDAINRSRTPAQAGSSRKFWVQWEWRWQLPR